MNIVKVFNGCFNQLLRGLKVTLEVTFLSLILAFFIGLLICLLRLSKRKLPRTLSKVYVSIIRGTPLIVQVFFIYFAMPQFIQIITGKNFRINSFAAAIISLSLNASSYISEILRGGVLAIDIGQHEAAESLGLSKKLVMFKIIFPQAIKIACPSLINQFIITLKDTSIVSVISLQEIVYEAKIYIGNSMETLGTWSIVAILYFSIISVLSKVSSNIERKFNNENKS